MAYALCETIEKRKDMMPTDNDKPLDVAQLERRRLILQIQNFVIDFPLFSTTTQSTSGAWRQVYENEAA